MSKEDKANHAHIYLYPDDFRKQDVWVELCEICGGNPRDEMLVINFEKGKAFTR